MPFTATNSRFGASSKIARHLTYNLATAAIIDQNALLSIAICDTCSKLQELINYHLRRTKNNITLKTLLRF